MAFLPILGGALGLIGSIIGANSQQHAANTAANAAQAGSSAETSLINQGILPILNELMSSWNQYYSPLQGGNASIMGGLSDWANTLPDLGAINTLASIDPSIRDAISGIPLQGITNNALNFYSNSGDTLSGLGGVGGDALSTFLNPNTNLQGVFPQVGSYLSHPQSTNLSDVTPFVSSYFANPGNTNLQTVTPGVESYFANPLNTNLAQVMPGVENYFANPQNTNVSRLAPGAISGLNPANMASGLGATGGTALDFFTKEAQQGFSPQTISAAVDPYNAQVQSQIASMRNSLGAATPNIAGSIEDMNLQGDQGRASLLSGIAGQNQQFQNEGMLNAIQTAFGIDQNTAQRIMQQMGIAGNVDAQNAQMFSMVPQLAGQLDAQTAGMLSQLPGLAGGLDMQTAQMLSQLPGLAGGLDSQTLQMLTELPNLAGQVDSQTLARMASAMQTAGGIDQQTMNMLNQAYNIANQQSGLGMNYLGQGVNTEQGLFSDLQNYLNEGRNMLPGVVQGFQNVAGLYGNAAGQAANNAMTLGMNQSNPFSFLGSFFASNPNMFGAPPTAPSGPGAYMPYTAGGVAALGGV